MAKKLTTVEMDGEVSQVLVEVPENEPVAWPATADLAVLGKPIPRVDGADKASGRAKYTHDINLPHMLWMKILRSELPHARIKRTDAGRARALPGVRLVLTADDVADFSWFGGRAPLLDSTMRYVGDEVAAVVAVDEHIAAEAVGLIDVEFEELPFVVDAEEAAREDAPPVLGPGGNVLPDHPWTYSRGDVERGFAEADHIVEAEFRSQYQMHACLETHCSVARWQGGRLTVWDSTQAVHPNRQALAEFFGIDLADVRLICLYSGGGFGSKLWLNKYTVLAAIAARRLNRPVKVTLDREEEAHATGNRPGNVFTIKAGCRKDGTLTALSLDNLGGIGAYFGGSSCGDPLRKIYRCPNVLTKEASVHTNVDTARPHRAPGYVQGTWGLEQVMDMLAAKCGMDPLGFRLKNYSDLDQEEDRPYSVKGLREVYRRGAEAFGWDSREQRRGRSTGTRKRGFGLATQTWGGAGGPPGYAIVKMYHDGSVMLYSGCQDIGTATRTSLLQVAAEELGLPADRVTCIMGDTQGTPYGFVSGGSRTTPTQAPAVRMAAAEVKKKLLELAAKQMEVPAARLDVRNGEVFDTDNPGTRKPVAEITRAELSYGFGTGDREHNMIIGTGWRGPNPDDVTVQSWGAQFAEVEVDTQTGEVRVVRIVAAHEVGRVLNPLTASSQVEGGVIQGIGFALFEERVVNRASGRIVNANLHDYKLPTAVDIPEIEVVFVDMPDTRANSVGNKGLGEPPIIPTPGAIANAIADAVGVHVQESPMTPPRVLAAIAKGGRRA